MNIAETPRLKLRLISLADVEPLHGLLYADPEVAVPWVGHVKSLRDVSGAHGLLSRIARAADEPGLIAIERSADFALIGVGGILSLRRAAERERFAPPRPEDAVGAVEGRVEGELDIALGRAHWNRGYATEAAQMLVGRGFNSLRFSRIIASAGDTNERATKLLRRLGFRIERNGRADPATGSAAPGTIGFLDAPGRR